MATTKIHEAFVHAADAGADLSAKLHFLAKVHTDGTIILATAGSAGFPIVEAAASGRPVTIQVGGIGKAVAGASFNAGVNLASDTDGKLVTAGGGVDVVGYSLAAADAGEVVSYLISHAPSP
ncbi:MAG: hypothetical protein K8E66_12005 [Phycisphaerales bacterium]|nr:hypothetical protein [Phycisphaerales bacterium]